MVSYRKGYERGLWYIVDCEREALKRYKATGRDKDVKLLEPILKAHEKLLSAQSVGVTNQQGA